MSVMLGGAKAYDVQVFGEVTRSLQWVNGEGAMCLYPTRKRGINPGGYIIMQDVAFKYAKSSQSGEPSEYLIRQSVKAAEVMGFVPDRFITKRIIDVIIDGLLDLLAMPPEPTGLNQKDTQAVGEMLVKVNGVTKVDGEINADNELIAS